MEEAADNRDYDASWGTDSPTAQDAYLAQRVGFPDTSSDTPTQESEYDASEQDSDAGSVFGFTGSSNFKVVIRVRPPLERELTGGKQFQNTVMVSEGHRVMTISENLAALSNRSAQASEGLLYSTHQFTFDYVYGQDSTQKSVYDHSAKDAVMSTLTGYNATIIAYGQTGTGKTYTMEGAREGETRGIIPRSIEYIFDYIENDTSASRKYLVRAAYLQIYNEVISDLLKPERTNLSIREEKRRGIFVEGLSEWVVRSPAEIYGLMERGAAQRAVGSTRMNEISSRSHAVFIIIAENVTVHGQDDDKARMPKPAANGQMSQSFKVGKLNLVDLAGSERVRLTGATGRRLEESKKINQSLSALGNVISALTGSGKMCGMDELRGGVERGRAKEMCMLMG
ncbi:hypothetical protein CYMTET_30522 [Cymbomonas tetramitiformis]|uniref:Kinesin-like protein n=1 Tax=Cymbomonas tetramitiformis TaxID=36881 RepID=A0AAE0FJ40_9CHLO|nr:hypothetical protein CYMTET_30522 [Cymbomonas tetramitiformis]